MPISFQMRFKFTNFFNERGFVFWLKQPISGLANTPHNRQLCFPGLYAKFYIFSWLRFSSDFFFSLASLFSLLNFNFFSNIKSSDFVLHNKKTPNVKKRNFRFRFVPTSVLKLFALKNANNLKLKPLAHSLESGFFVSSPSSTLNINWVLPSRAYALSLKKGIILNSSFFFPNLKKQESFFLKQKKRPPLKEPPQIVNSGPHVAGLGGNRSFSLLRTPLTKQSPRFGFSQGVVEERHIFKGFKFKPKKIRRLKKKHFQRRLKTRFSHYQFNFLKTSMLGLKIQNPRELSLGGLHVSKFSQKAKTNPVKFTETQLQPKIHPSQPEPSSLFFPFRQPTVRYKPGLTKYWRLHRLSFWVNYTNHNPTRQLNLTKYVQKLRSVAYFELFRLFSMSLGFLAWQSLFLTNKPFSFYWISVLQGCWCVNGRRALNPYHQCYKGDIISMVSKKPMRMLDLASGNCFFDWSLQPKWLKFKETRGEWPSVFSFCETDHLTLSLILIKNPTPAVLSALSNFSIPPHATLKMYNWKYLT